MGVPEAEKTNSGGCNSMSDHFKFDVMVTITDRWELGIGQKERGDEIKQACADAVKKVLEEKGFREYREEFSVIA